MSSVVPVGAGIFTSINSQLNPKLFYTPGSVMVLVED